MANSHACAHESGIYAIEHCASSKAYIGSAVNIRARWLGHKRDLRNLRHKNAKLQCAWNKYGGDGFSFKVLLICTKNDLIFYEQRAIDAYHERGEIYNMCKVAGSALGRSHSQETIEKIRLSSLGRKPSAECIQNAAAKNKVRLRTAEETAKRSGAMTGYKHSTEARAKISTAHKGRVHSAEAKMNMQQAQRRIVAEAKHGV